ncbi:hypothetical protein [Streptomyces sp. 6N223]|uniref:hypothetical protein n=1 Tax=Streptomyces sp. 6N223 TaxID=3457412 RepID=UPI003FD08318
MQMPTGRGAWFPDMVYAANGATVVDGRVNRAGFSHGTVELLMSRSRLKGLPGSRCARPRRETPSARRCATGC